MNIEVYINGRNGFFGGVFKSPSESLQNVQYLFTKKSFRKPLQMAGNGLRIPNRFEIVGCSGYYTQSGAIPSLEAAKKITDAFGVSLDYLVGEGINSKFDKKTVKRLEDIERLDNEDKGHVFAMLDAFLLKCSIQKNFSH